MSCGHAKNAYLRLPVDLPAFGPSKVGNKPIRQPENEDQAVNLMVVVAMIAPIAETLNRRCRHNAGIGSKSA